MKKYKVVTAGLLLAGLIATGITGQQASPTERRMRNGENP